MKPKPTRLRRGLILLLKLAIGLGLLSIAIYSNRDQVRAVLGGRLHAGYFSFAFVLAFLGLMIAFVRWFILVRAADIPIRLIDAFRLGFIGNLFNLVIPGAVGGDLVKAAYFLREQPGRKTRAAASIALDRVIGLLGLFVLALVVGSAGWTKLDASMRRLVLLVAALTCGVILVLAIAFTPRLFHALHNRVRARKRLATLLNELGIMGTAYRSRPLVLASTLGLAITTHLLNVSAFYLVSRSMFDTIPTLTTHLLIVPLVLFSTAIPLPFGALGVSEGISQGLFKLVAYDGGAVAMMGFRVLQYIGCIPSLLVYLANRQEVADLATPSDRGEVVGSGASPNS
jgi:glycosyltransferase 2 family protein